MAFQDDLNSTYNQYLGRDIKQEGRDYWQNDYDNGATFDQISQNIQKSPEAQGYGRRGLITGAQANGYTSSPMTPAGKSAVTGYNPTNASSRGYSGIIGKSVGYEATGNESEGYDAQGYTPDSDALATETLNKILDKNGAYIQQARYDGRANASRRGLLDTSVSADSAQASAIRAAAPLATTDSGRYYQSGMENTAAENRSREFESSARNRASELNANRETAASQFGADAANRVESEYTNAQNRAEEFGASAENTAELANSLKETEARKFEAGASNLASREQTAAANRAAEFNATAINRAGEMYAGAQNAASITNANNELALSLQSLRDELSTYQTDAQRETALDQIAYNTMNMALNNGIFNDPATSAGFFKTISGIIPSLGIQIAADLADAIPLDEIA